MSRFSDFIRNASEAEKAEVYGEVMAKVAEQQQAVVDEWVEAKPSGIEMRD